MSRDIIVIQGVYHVDNMKRFHQNYVHKEDLHKVPFFFDS